MSSNVAKIGLVAAAVAISGCTPPSLAERPSALTNLNRSSYVVMENAPLGPVLLPSACATTPERSEAGVTPSAPLGCASVLAYDATLYRPDDRLSPRRPGNAMARTLTVPAMVYLGPEQAVRGFDIGRDRQGGSVSSPPMEDDSDGAPEAAPIN